MTWEERRREYLIRAGRFDQLEAEQGELRPQWKLITPEGEKGYEVEGDEPIHNQA